MMLVEIIQKKSVWLLLVAPVWVLFHLSTEVYFSTPSSKSQLTEICDNGIDDDQDGFIDLNDPDCDCEIIEPISLIPNPSFEDMDCCPQDRSELDCASVWIQASVPTTDYIHRCGWMGWDDFPPPLPFPDGEGIMGFRDGRVRQNGNTPEPYWKEYAGACLLNPLQKDTSYRFEFDLGFVNREKSPNINISFFGTSDCNNLPFGLGNQNFGCPSNSPDWVKLGATFVNSESGWVKVFIEVVPDQNIAAIAIGPDCLPVSTPISIYYFFDNLLLADAQSFQLQIREVNHPCQDDFTLAVPESSVLQYQWFKDGIALVGETAALLSTNYGEGDYQIRIDDGIDCRVSVSYEHNVPILSNPENVILCEGDTYSFGDRVLTQPGSYVDTFKSFYNCDSIVFLNLKILGTIADTVQAKIFEGEAYIIGQFSFEEAGDHLVTLNSSLGCDSLVLLQLDFFNVYFPNVFTPNLDGFNDEFQVYSGSGLIEESQLSIYNRWGALVYKGSSWDGFFNGKVANEGVYVYSAVLRMSDGVERRFSGAVTLLW